MSPRAGVTVVCFINGALFASWASRIPALSDRVGATPGALAARGLLSFLGRPRRACRNCTGMALGGGFGRRELPFRCRGERRIVQIKQSVAGTQAVELIDDHRARQRTDARTGQMIFGQRADEGVDVVDRAVQALQL